MRINKIIYYMKLNLCIKFFVEFIRKNFYIEFGNEMINDILYLFIKFYYFENFNEKSWNSLYVNESEEMGREGERVFFEYCSEGWYLWWVIFFKVYIKILYFCFFENFDIVVYFFRVKIV